MPEARQVPKPSVLPERGLLPPEAADCATALAAEERTVPVFNELSRLVHLIPPGNLSEGREPPPGRIPVRSTHTLIIPSLCCRSLGRRRGDTVWPDALRLGVRSRWHNRIRTMLATVPTSCARSFIVVESEQECPSLHPPFHDISPA
jgi:hypothetical protein